MTTLTVTIAKSEVDALRYACALTDETVYVHEDTKELGLAKVTIECRSVEMLYAVIRSWEARLSYERNKFAPAVLSN